MSKLRDLQARLAAMASSHQSPHAGNVAQVIHNALSAAGLLPRNPENDPPGKGDPAARSAAAPHERGSMRVVNELLAGLGAAPAWREQADTEAAGATIGGRFVDGAFSNEAGTRRYKVYIPAAYTGQAMPLVVMLHGCTQDPDDFARGTQMNALAEEKGFMVVYPAQDAQANTSKCWNWFHAIDQQRGQGEPSLIAGITTEVIARYALDGDKVYVAGLSAGGAMAVIMGSTYPDLYSAVGVHSGLPYASASDLPSAFSAMKGIASRRRPGTEGASSTEPVPIIVFHGDRDTTVSPANGAILIDDFVARFPDGEKITTLIEEGKASGGRGFSRTSLHAEGRPVLAEHWVIRGAGHAWAGGSPRGTFTDAGGPDASQEMLRFFDTQSSRGPAGHRAK
ncbi:PHB depolymerase family esterase [Herbaspirillum sp. WKF16]|uniref:extracellular catalytic domain type 1 short-chain-length polyhydroxyalkanoate depolymerase n=1 Tax=Herbaspirillum sp. WKF16 TaxID=3028312 RepID=UPI0023A970A0|nr:PHB depolymerase family esterase [Herbaspirillum sp. WKF16]WDZ94106.1 PHB depolymerase family esterase [Herbaspirillum sp. WKF16]